MAISSTSDTMVGRQAELIIKAAWDDIPVFNYTNLIKFNLDARNLADAWKNWKEELNLYIDLTMDDDNEPAKVKLFLYLIGTRGQEI
jgi:hypothetical protein